MEEQTRIRLEKIEKIEALGIECYPYEFDMKDNLLDLKKRYSDSTREELEEKKINVNKAGVFKKMFK